MSETTLDKETVRYTSDGDHDIFAHYVNKNDMMTSVVEGVPLIALCGKIWIPSRDPEKYPVCPTCKDIYKEMF